MFEALPEQFDDLESVFRLRADAQHVDAELRQFVELVDQIASARGLRLDAVESEKRLALAGQKRHAVGMVYAAKLATVLGQVVAARGEAARRKRERQAPIAEYFGRHRRRLVL